MKNQGQTKTLLQVIACASWFLVVLLVTPGCSRVEEADGPIGQHGVQVLRSFGQLKVDEGRPGRPVVEAVLTGRGVTDETMKLVSELTELHALELHDVRVTDAGIRRIVHLTRLKRLDLDGVQITDLGLSALALMKNLEFLSLYDSRVTHGGLEQLQGLPSLHVLYLPDQTIDDRALVSLHAMTQLKELWLLQNQVTQAGFQRFERARPGVLKGPECGTVSPAVEIELEQRRLRRQGFTGRLRLAWRSIVSQIGSER